MPEPSSYHTIMDLQAANFPESHRTVQEMHIDFLLEEEFAANPVFAGSFLYACNSAWAEHPVTVLHVARSLTGKHGEIDLRVELATGIDQKRRVLLIENKIGAMFQPDQAKRYRQAAELEQAGGADVVTILVAPCKYIKKGHNFERHVSYEAMQEWFGGNTSQRSAVKCRIINDAINKASQTGVIITDSTMTSFRRKYYDQLQGFNALNSTDFRMREPSNTYYGDTWFQLKSPRLRDWMRFRHMSDTGYAEMSFANTDPIRAESYLRQFAPEGFFYTSTGKYHQHATIRRSVPKIADFDHYELARHTVEEALVHMAHLLDLAVKNLPALEAALTSARKQPHASPQASPAPSNTGDAPAGV